MSYADRIREAIDKGEKLSQELRNWLSGTILTEEYVLNEQVKGGFNAEIDAKQPSKST